MSMKMMLKAGLVLALAGAPALSQNNNNGNSDQPAQPTVQAQGDLPSVDEVSERAVEAIGGREAMDKVKTLHTVMTMTVMGSTITMDNKWSREGGRFTANESPFGNSEMGTDGQTAWMKMPPDRYVLMDEAQAEQLDGQASMHINMLDPKVVRRNMDSMEVVGREEFAGQMAHKLRFEPKDSEGHGFMYFDVRDGRPLGLMQTEDTPMGEQTTTITLGDWKTVEGIQFFHTMKIESPAMPGGSVEMKVTKLEVNSLEDSAFALPEKVKELAAAAAEEEAEQPAEGDAGNGAATEEIKLEDLPETYRERAKTMVDQMKAGGKEAATRTIQQLEGMMDSMPEGDDKLTMQYVIQELKKVK
jgi:outer membrane lipoprotein-sorting protein